ncbi:hypothetical protein RND81_04G208400 [Saponaria officinalis]
MIPVWLDGHRRKLLEATNLAEDLKAKANVVVAQDGSGKYKTIEEALGEIPKYGNESFIIYIKEGVYNEYLVVYKWMTHVVFVGDGPTKTRITNNKNFVDGVKTFKTATLSVLGDFFMAKDIGVENSAGAIKHQAVALRVQSDQSIFYNCHMDGYQDTLYTHTYRQFYRDCRVTGTIDFIFGDAAAFFQNCTFVVRKPLDNQRCIVTAQGRMERHQPTGIIIHKCRFESDPEYYPVRKTNTAYLARPWKEYSKTIIMESYIDDLIAPEGWLPWEGTFGLETCYYGEYNNEGPGSDMSNRVKWRGIKTIVPSRAEKSMPPHFYENDDWIRASGIPYDPSLSTLAPGPGGFDEDPNGAPEGAPLVFQSFYPGSSSGTSSTSSSAGHSSSSSSSGGSSSSSSSSSSSTASSILSYFTSSGSSSSDSTPSSSSSDSTPSSSSLSSYFSPSNSSSSETTRSSSSSTSTSSSSSSSSSSSIFSYFTFGGSSSSGTTPSEESSSTTPSSSSTSSSSSSSSSTNKDNQGGSTQQGPKSPAGPTEQGPNNPTKQGPIITESPRPTPGLIDVQSPMMAPLASPSPSPSPSPSLSLSSSISPSPSLSLSLSPTSTPNTISTKVTGLISPTTSIISSPSPSPAQPKRKLSGPVTIHELERMLMTNEEMGEEEDDQANDDMSGNVPDGDEPGPSMVPTPSPNPGPASSPSESTISSPTPSPGPGPSPSDEVSDWLPPASAPGPDVEPEAADKVPPKPAPKASDAKRNTLVNELHVILSSMLLWVVLAM